MDSLGDLNNLNTCCRTCLNNTSDRMYISIFALRDDSVSVAEMLSSCTSIKVHCNDKLPKKLCGSCYNCLISFYDFKKLAETINTKLWNHFQECKLTVSDDVPDVMLKEMKAEIMDLGLNTYHDGEESETYLENGKSNENSEPECYQDDNTTHFRHSIKGESVVLSDFDDVNQAELVECKSNSTSELKCHGTTHSGQREFRCDQCGSAFTKQSSLGRHKFRHTGIKPHRCDACSMNFISNADLKRHYRMHTGEKPYRCGSCERAFSQNGDLMRHQRKHFGDNQYSCTQCTETFRLKSELHKHISEHYITLNVPEPVPTGDNNLPNAINDMGIEMPCDNVVENNEGSIQN